MSSFRHNSSLLASRSENNNNNNIVTIDLSHHPPNGKLGMLLAPGSLPTPISSSDNTSTTQSAAAALPTASNVTLVAGWEHGNNQQLGPIQRSGMVRLGDRLVRINGRDVTDWTFREIMDVLKEMITANHQTTATSEINSKHKRKKKLSTLGFAPSGTDEWSRGVIVGGEEFNSSSMLFGLFQSHESKISPHVISKSKYSFVSFVGRWRVVDESVTDVAVASTASATRSDKVKRVEQPRQDDDRQQQQQQRQISENSTDLLEEQLNKEPSMKFDSDGPIDIPEHDDEQHDETTESQQQSPKQDETTTPSIFSSEAEAEWHKEITEFQQKNNPPQPKKIVQYEIQCHLLLRDPNSFKSSSNNNHNTSHHHHHGIMNKNTIHHSWSVWKRYSEFQSLDTELRHTFGWQMDATGDGKGIVFPGVHGLESWWYGWRNGGGYLTSLMGGSYGVEVDDGDARVDEEADNGNKKEKGKKIADKGSSGMFGFFSNTNATTTETAATTSSTSAHRNHDEDFNNRASISSSTSTSKTCPYPRPFIEKRQKELTAYWISLSRVEDIFEFSDVNSHRFGTLMASFLEVDQVLLSRRSNSRAAGAGAGAGTASNQQRYHQPTSPSRLTVPVIHEDETELYSFGARKSEQWLSPMTPAREFSGITFNDDDVSMLSDGTGANAYLTPVPPGRRLLVDNVPAQFTSNNPLPLTAENRSVSSRSTKRGGGRGASRRPKPAFQRQFMD